MGKKDDLKNFIEELEAIKNIAVWGKKRGAGLAMIKSKEVDDLLGWRYMEITVEEREV